MGLFVSNILYIAGIGILLIVMIAYFVTRLRLKNEKKTKFVQIFSEFNNRLRKKFRRTDFFAGQQNDQKIRKESDTTSPLWGDSSRHPKHDGKPSARTRPDSPPSHTHLGNLNFERRNYGKAAWYYKQALQIDRKFGPAHVGIGNIEYRNGKIFSAMRFYTFAIKMNSKNHDALVGLGNCFQHIGKNEKALDCYEQAYDINTRNKDLNASISNLYIATKEYKKAGDILKRSIALYPNCSRFYKSIGDMYSSLNKERKAIDAYIHFIDLKCDKDALTNLVRSKFERYLALEIISDLIKRQKKINYDAFVKELSRMMTIYLIRQKILGTPSITKHRAYRRFASYFIDKVLLCIVQQQNHPSHETTGCNLSTELQPYPNSIV